MNAPESWLCPTCHKVVASAFCPDCGEHQFDFHALTLRGLAEQIFLSLTSVDSKLIRSVLLLVARPGALTVAYLEGLHARSWIIVMALSFTPLPLLVSRRQGMPVAAHAVFVLRSSRPSD